MTDFLGTDFDNDRKGTDPLTPATRIAKRNLLAVAITAIFLKSFEIPLQEIGGVKFPDPSTVPSILFMLLLYFLITFFFYLFPDIKNRKPTQHEQNLFDTPWRQYSRYINTSTEYIIKSLNVSFAKNNIELQSSPNIYLAMEKLATLQAWVNLDLVLQEIRSTIMDNIYEHIPRYGDSYDSPTVFSLAHLDDKEIQSLVWDYFVRGCRNLRASATVIRLGYEILKRIYIALYNYRLYIIDSVFPIFIGLLAVSSLLGRADLAPILHLLPPITETPLEVAPLCRGGAISLSSP